MQGAKPSAVTEFILMASTFPPPAWFLPALLLMYLFTLLGNRYMATIWTVTEFILIGFSTFPHLQLMFFLLFLLMYLFTLLGNLLIMSTIWSERSLHTPTYLFLWALSISESLYTFVNIPCMLTDLISTHHSISFTACASQMFFSFTFGFTHSSLLTVMGYDRYVAICHPRATRCSRS
ncbi:Olfactory receptor 10H1 [Camelus dromedarius]|uniref:Olfactory receptor 10H1 n=1 Tax=Camelus dromedarius TaxID=9838 RepID=A0A5N4CMM0_CAMDR|nr:Olfactory receptor 10H1 [Camelus dromedarius]